LGNFTTKATGAGSPGHLSAQVEESLLESFVEDDYDGKLHLTTLDRKDDGRPVGVVFWREMPEEEMRDWIHWDNLRQRLLGEQRKRNETKKSQQQVYGTDENNTSDEEEDENGDTFDPKKASSIAERRSQRSDMRRSLRMVRNESIRWLELASNSNASANLYSSTSSNSASVDANESVDSTPSILKGLTQSWIKIELLAVHPDFWTQHIGTLLMACAMYQAYQHGGDHMILHVAGGTENVPARRLYDKFGFTEVPQGTYFQKPDRDLFVLGHVGESLQQLCWPALEV